MSTRRDQPDMSADKIAQALQLAAKAALDGGQQSSGEFSSDSLVDKSTPFAEAGKEAFGERGPDGRPRRSSLDGLNCQSNQMVRNERFGERSGATRHAAHLTAAGALGSCWPGPGGMYTSRSSSGSLRSQSVGKSLSNPGLLSAARKSIEVTRPSLEGRPGLEHTTYEDVGPVSIIRDADGQQYLIQPIRESVDIGGRVSFDGRVAREGMEGGNQPPQQSQSEHGHREEWQQVKQAAEQSWNATMPSEFSRMSISRQSIDENRDASSSTFFKPSRPAEGNLATGGVGIPGTAGRSSGGGGHVGQMYLESLRQSAPVSIGAGTSGAGRLSSRSHGVADPYVGSQGSLDYMHDFVNQRTDAEYVRYSDTGFGMDSEWEIDIHDLHFGPRIGRGAYGEVFKGVYRETEVAIKLFVDQDVSDKLIEAFRKEVDILKKLRHPNILHFMGYCTVPPHMCIVTEFENNGSLFKLLHRTNIRLDNAQKLKIALETAIGMHYLHTSKPPIVHGDLKSPNLLLGDNLHVKICDFGLSRFRMASKLSAGSKLGTPEWTAPEVLQSSTNSEAGDVYSYGVVLWELFTGQIPWEEISAMQVVLMVGFHQARLTIPEDAPTWAREMMESCFRAAEARPSFSDIISRLRCQSGEGI